jgi:hypothetical protein
MTFDKQAEFNELEFHIELIFKSGNDPSDVISLGPSAYIAMGSWTTDGRGRPMITTEEMSFDALRAQVEYIKGALDARLGEAKARFAAAVS